MEVRVLLVFVRWWAIVLPGACGQQEERRGAFWIEVRVATCPGPDVHPRASIVVQELVIVG
jgi:hypothetical protein